MTIPNPIRLLLIPYYEAETLCRIMAQRADRLKLAQIYYIEYLKLMAHYKFLDKEQKQHLKDYITEQENLSKMERGEEVKPKEEKKAYNPFE